MSAVDTNFNYGWKDTAPPGSCGYLAPRVLAIVKRLGARRVLDLGCGNGALCGKLRQMGCAVVGCEYDRQGAEIARATNPEIPIINCGVEDDPQSVMEIGGRFDCVVSTEVVEHLYAPHLLPRFAGKVLKDGGMLILSTPYHGYIKNLALALVDKWDRHHDPLWHGGHIKFWSRRTLTRLLEDNGFQVIGFEGVGRVPYLWKSMILIGRANPDGFDIMASELRTPPSS